MIRKTKITILLLLLIFIFGCSESNPILGTWKAEFGGTVGGLLQNEIINNKKGFDFAARMLGVDTNITFIYEKDLVRIKTSTGEQVSPIFYKKDTDTVWLVSEDGKKWVNYTLIDKDTIKINTTMFGMEFILKRQK